MRTSTKTTSALAPFLSFSFALVACLSACGGDDASSPDGTTSSEADGGSTPQGATEGACGGNTSIKCANGRDCTSSDDCASGFCSGASLCVTPSIDGSKNGDETDVDCGGAQSPKCANGKGCATGASCESGVCDPSTKTCAPPSYTDGVKNGDETDKDCGGNPAAPGFVACADTLGCVAGTDCKSKVCDATTKTCSVPAYGDGVKNGSETDVDCGGDSTATGFVTCDDTKTCVAGTDCKSKVCDGTTKKCNAPTYADDVQNGDETDKDCGGNPANAGFKACAVGKTCANHTDCTSNGCAYDNTCAPHASCTQQNGGNTCGANGNESCCKEVSVTASAAFGGDFRVDKYLVTAGRMRAFIDRVNGNVKDWVKGNTPSWWDSRWTNWLPVSKNGHVNDDYGQAVPSTGLLANDGKTIEHINITSAWAQVSGGIIYDQPSDQGCNIGTSYGHPTFFVPKDDANKIYGDNYDRWMPQSALDKRPLNCTTWVMFAALCAFDGGQIISEPEYALIYDANGNPTGSGYTTTTRYPWGATPDSGGYGTVSNTWTKIGPAWNGTTTACPTCTEDRVNWRFVWQDPAYYPEQVAADVARRKQDQSYFISPPGTFPLGGSRMLNGDSVQDIAGLMIEMTRTFEASDATPTKTWTISFGDTSGTSNRTSQPLQNIHWRGGSWEVHALNGRWTTSFNPVTKYGKAGTRCVYR